MKIHVKRTNYTTTSTIGELSIEGKFIAYTLEDVVRPAGAAKVYGQTAIPAGVYPVSLYFSPKYQCNMPHIDGIPGFRGVLFHAGNWATDTEGCVLVGTTKGTDYIGEARVAFNKLFKLLQDGHKMTVTVEDTQPSPLPAKPVKKK